MPAGREAAALAPLPLARLGLPAERQEILHRWGLRTIGDLARLPPVALAERFGPDGPRLVRLARGEDEGLLVPAPLPERFETTLELDWPVDGLEPLAFLLSRVLEPLCATLAARGAKAASLAVELGLVDGTAHARVLKPAAPSGEARTWRTLVLLDLEAHPPRDAIARITARAEPTPARAGAVLAPRPRAALAGAARGDDGASRRLDGRGSRWLAAARGHPPPRGLRRLDLRAGAAPAGEAGGGAPGASRGAARLPPCRASRTSC